MNSADLENLTLLIVHDAAENGIWTQQWTHSYPTVQTVRCAAADGIGAWQRQIRQAADTVAVDSGSMMALIGHGAGANAGAAWYYQTDTAMQRRIAAVILAAPLQAAWPDDEEHVLQRVRFNCKTAWVAGQDDAQSPEDWGRQTAALWGARFLKAPQNGHLNRRGDNWQWGMKLLQEMLL